LLRLHGSSGCEAADETFLGNSRAESLSLQEELLAVLTMMVGANISPEQLLSIAERTILEADEDKDDLISFEEFVKVLERTDVEQKMSIRFLN
jgi:calcineurin B family protein 1